MNSSNGLANSEIRKIASVLEVRNSLRLITVRNNIFLRDMIKCCIVRSRNSWRKKVARLAGATVKFASMYFNLVGLVC